MRRSKLLAVLFWFFLWEGAAILFRDSIVFVGPFSVLKSLVFQARTLVFWLSLGNSMCRIMGGFLISFAAALLLGSLAFWHSWLKILLEPAVLLLKSVPVASFVVLLLILMGSKNLSTAIVILTSFPMLYTGVLSGLSQTDPKLLEMAQVFDMNPLKECLFLYRPALLPFLTGSSQTALGMSWKSGTAAEIIGVPAHSIGEQLYMSKIYLNTASLFAWTTMIILLSLVFEKLFLYLLKKAAGKTWEDSYADPKPL